MLPAVGPAPDAEVLTAVDPGELRAGLGADAVRRRIVLAARREETERRVLAFYLVEMDTRRLYQETGHGSTAHFAETRAELDRRRVAELVRVGRRLLELREIDRAFCEARLGWSKVLVLARVASPEHEAAWLERALALDVRALTLLAARSRAGGPPRAAGDEKGLPEIRFPVNASVSPLAHATIGQAQRRLSAELGREVDLGELFHVLAGEFLATDSVEVERGEHAPDRRRVDASIYRVELAERGTRGAPLFVETDDGPMPVDAGGLGPGGAVSEAVRCDAGVRNHRASGRRGPGDLHDHRARDVKTPPRMRRSVLRRDGRRCRSCRSRWSLMVHHVEFRSHGGRTLTENLITLCSRCHGLVHAKLLFIEGASADAARFVDAAGRALEGREPIAALERVLLAPPAFAERGGPDGGPGAGPGAVADARVVTLGQVPAEVDATWWRRHAHLVRDRGEQGSLRFEAGAPVEIEPPAVPPPAPASDAFAGLVGQEERVARLRQAGAGARARGRDFPHVLLCGPAGTGKSTLARGTAAVAGAPLVEVSAPLVTDRATFVRLLAGLPEGGVLFLDEAHALPRPLLEVLLEAMSERRLSLVLSDGVSARRVAVRLPAFTLVAATTDEGAIPQALRSRFGLRETLVHYGEDALVQVVAGAAAKEGAAATPEAARRLARASRGTPREALRLVDRVLDATAATGTTRIDDEVAARALAGLGYDEEGLDPGERRYVEVLRESPTPVPLSRLARVLGATVSTLVEHVEPWLFARDLVRMAPGGRTAAPRLRYLPARGQAPNVRRDVPHAAPAT